MSTLVVVRASATAPADKDRWQTPPELFARLAAEYGPFALDAAADADNHLCPRWFGPGGEVEDALAAPWWDYARRIFCHPPYSRGMVDQFMRRGHEAARRTGTQVTYLVPADTDPRWWHELVYDQDRRRFRRGVEVELLQGRVRFLRPDGTRGGAGGFGSAVITFGGL